ncbi:MAG: spore cortex biosynthesis protein YabQ [Bacillota bacterium]
MLDSLEVQVYRFLVMTAAGIGTGLGFDLFRAWRGFARPRGWAVHLSDLAFMCVACVFLATALVYGTWGDLRLYVYLAFVLGTAIYFSLGSSFMLALFVAWFRLMGVTTHYGMRCARAAYAPVGWAGSQLVRPIRWASRSGQWAGRRAWSRAHRWLTRKK